MSERLDDRIRELYSELTDAAPELPPLPARTAAAAPPWRRRVILASATAAVVVVVVGVGAALFTQVEFGAGEDDAAAPAATVPAPSPPAATAAPGSPPATFVEAPGEPAAEDPGQEGTPRPVERILLLADLNRSCSEAAAIFAEELPPQLVTQEDYQSAFGLIFDRLEELRVIVEEANPDLTDDELLEVADVIFAAEGSVVLGGDEPVTGGYPVEVIEDLAGFLTEFGAADCVSLSSNLP